MTTEPHNLPPLPDPPERTPEEKNTFNHLSITGNMHHLKHHFGNMDTTLISGDLYVSRGRPTDMTGLRYPDLIIAFGVNPAAYRQSNAYIISEQGKPPDFVLEIAAPLKGHDDVENKPADYAALAIAEYWRFDETGDFHGTKLAGDQLVAGLYEPIPIVEVGEGVLQGYSTTLNLNIRWSHGRLEWHDPQTGEHIITFKQERERRLQAEARTRELEAELERWYGKE